jgi:hypothetical protein
VKDTAHDIPALPDIWVASTKDQPAHIIADARQLPGTIHDTVFAWELAGFKVQRYRASRGPGVARHASETVVQTPGHFLAAVEGRFGPIAFDIAASPGLGVAGDERRWGPEHNALEQDWTALSGVSWLNPPFDPAEPWVKRAAETKLAWDTFARVDVVDAIILVLLPFAPGARWWRRWVNGHADVMSIGRITFVGCPAPFPKDLALLRYARGSGSTPLEYWEWPGRLKGRKKKSVVSLP